MKQDARMQGSDLPKTTTMNKSWSLKEDPANYDDEGRYCPDQETYDRNQEADKAKNKEADKPCVCSRNE